MSRFFPYPEYKDSGVEWLGKVPAHWEVERLKLSVESCRNGIWGEEPAGDSGDLPCVRVADFDRPRLRVFLDNPTMRNVKPGERNGRVLKRGDLVLEKSGGGEKQPVGFVVLYDDDRPAVYSNFTAKIELSEGMNPSFWRYVHAAAYSIRLNVPSIKQTSGIQNLDQQSYLDERAAYPPSYEQAHIASFLDHETARIDALVEQQQRLIELLKEKRQAVISHAVTKGLDPDVPMEDSGVEWLGKVPAHWGITRVKHIVRTIEQGWSPQCENSPVESESEWGVLKVGCVNHGRFVSQENKKLPAELSPRLDLSVKADDVLISRANTRELVGSCAVPTVSYPNLMLSDKLFRLRLRERVADPKFLAFFMGAPQTRQQIELEATGASSSMLNIGQSTVLEMTFPCPPFEEQEKIRDEVIKQTWSLLNLAGEALELKKRLEERRSALISAAVTGKIDVRGWQPQSGSTAPNEATKRRRYDTGTEHPTFSGGWHA